MKSFFRVAVLLTAFGAAPRPALAAEPSVMSWTVNGEAREALVFAPSSRAAGKAPVVHAFHGHGGNMRGASTWMRFQDSWPEAIVVYPQGLATKTKIDPRGVRPGWQREPGQNGDRDLKLVDTILATLRQKFAVDESRIYAAGFSNGGFFSYLLWARRGAEFAAFGVCAGLVVPDLPPAEPRPVIHIGGESDPIVHFSDQEETIRTILRWNGCSTPGEPCGERCTRYASSRRAPVVVVVHPGGHVFPRWAGVRIAKFFQSHPLTGARN
ncbi:MAG: alpha/beta hydrolase family esterase [Thermoanaerobaculia bacterium]